MDVKIAFLDIIQEEEMNMQQPEGFVKRGK
jgi:hypothetical protein